LTQIPNNCKGINENPYIKSINHGKFLHCIFLF
jgi:hypothetical protein